MSPQRDEQSYPLLAQQVRELHAEDLRIYRRIADLERELKAEMDLRKHVQARVDELEHQGQLDGARKAALANRVAEMELLGCPRCRRTE